MMAQSSRIPTPIVAEAAGIANAARDGVADRVAKTRPRSRDFSDQTRMLSTAAYPDAAPPARQIATISRSFPIRQLARSVGELAQRDARTSRDVSELARVLTRLANIEENDRRYGPQARVRGELANPGQLRQAREANRLVFDRRPISLQGLLGSGWEEAGPGC